MRDFVFMQTTHLTLLQRAGTGATDAWSELDHLYRPFVRGWFLTHAVAPADAEDLTQDVLTALFKELPEFRHSGRAGAFRSWLRNICLNRLLGYRRMLATRGRAAGGTEFQEQILALASDDPLSADWDREHDQAILRYLFELVETQFEPETMAVFRRLSLDGKTTAEVATEFGMSTGAVYVTRSRVLRRLREEGKRLLGEDIHDTGDNRPKSETV